MALLKKLLLWSITGPFLVWAALMLHVIYHHGFTEPGGLSAPQWPDHIKPDMKEAMIANRKYIIDDLKAVMSGILRPAKFISTRVTADFIWEDPLERFDGASDVGAFLGMCQYLDGATFKVHHEVHSAHEILLDWEIAFGFKGLSHIPWLKVNIPMRTHLLLEPAEKPGSSERLFKLYEEWGGNVLLTEKSLPMPPYLGLIHQSLRRFTGSLVLWPAKKGLL